ncbi:hypothetical protein BKA65DRAFT_540841 [Rhexocercosporidium sp. MPI-PUGE-AT-0058]|nr:hypothetical protein BKA65DRAFT_540841 [Rhexocercosporidium sp. MPI-PUGE-AT-0058]
MLTCHGCMRHCLQTIIGDSALLSAASRPAFAVSLNNRPLRRSYTGTSYERSRAGQEASRSRPGDDRPYERTQAGNDSRRDKHGDTFSYRSSRDGKEESRKIRSDSSPRTQQPWGPGNNVDVSPRTIERKKWLDSRGIRPTSKKQVQLARTESNIRHHLSHLSDPLKLADFVRQTLRRDEFDFAEELVRTASKNTKCVVSWNHLVEWQLSKGKMNAAIATYNEMKKRAQVPDAYTYTILFRGCAEHRDSGNALPKVLDIYNSMRAEKSPVKPNTIHLNCVLKMCSRAGNIDAMFAIAGHFGQHGLTAANNLTFTIMLNALRTSSISASRGALTPMERRAWYRDTIARSRDVWKDVIDRWRKGDIWIDEELVSTMGRLLLIGQEDDKDDVFSLIEQTMNIPRQIPKLGTPERARIEPASQVDVRDPIKTSKTRNVEGETIENVSNSKDKEAAVASNTSFEAVKAPVTKEDGIAMYAKPGQNSLSLILQAALDLNLKAPATAYWNIFTKSYLVQPDAENFHAYMRILRMARASTEMIEVLSQMSTRDMEVKTFRLAMATCARDKRNPNSFSNANKVLDTMTRALREPDVQSLEQYLEVAIESPSKEKIQNAQGEQILRALNRLNPSFINLKAAMQFTPSGPDTGTPKVLFDRIKSIEGVIRLASGMVRAFDLLMNKALVPREKYGDLTKERSKMSAFITRYQHAKTSQTSSPSGNKQGHMMMGIRSENNVPSNRFRQSPESGTERSQTNSWMAAGI